MNRHALLMTALLLAAALPAAADTPRKNVYPRESAEATGAKKKSAIASTPANAGWDDRRVKASRREFQRKSGFPRGRPGYVVDYIVPLSQGGEPKPANMQWVRVDDLVNRHRR